MGVSSTRIQVGGGGEVEPRTGRPSPEVLPEPGGARRLLALEVNIMLDPAQNEFLRNLLTDKEQRAQYSLRKIDELWDTREKFSEEIQKAGIQIDFNNPESVVKGIFHLQLVCGFHQDLVNDKGENISGMDAKYGPNTHQTFLRYLENYSNSNVETAPAMGGRLEGLRILNDAGYQQIAGNPREVSRRALVTKNFLKSTQWDIIGFRDAIRNATGKDLNFRNNSECVAGVYYLQKIIGFSGGDLDAMYGEKTHLAFTDMLLENGIDTPFSRMPRNRRS